jgi:type II restriction enzyme
LTDDWQNLPLLDRYRSNSQRARVMSEAWVLKNGYCLACTADSLSPTVANTRTKDFFCPACLHGYELKSKQGPFGSRVVDGAYSSMLATIQGGRTPTLLLLEFSPGWSVEGLTAVHHSLVTQDCIVARKPLGPLARRAGWTGCNIILPSIAAEGRIPIIIDGKVNARETTRKAFARLQFLEQMPVKRRSWAATLLNLLRQLHRDSFSLSDAYEFEGVLAKLYPGNNNLRPKIRQQLQILRDAGILRFVSRGQYRFNSEVVKNAESAMV